MSTAASLTIALTFHPLVSTVFTLCYRRRQRVSSFETSGVEPTNCFAFKFSKHGVLSFFYRNRTATDGSKAVRAATEASSS